MAKLKKCRGSIIFLTLLTLVVLLIYSAALISLNAQNLNLSSINHDSLQAQQMAQAGVNHLMNKLTYSSTFGSDPSSDKIEYVSDDGTHGYLVTFDPVNSNHSVNNLDSLVEHPTMNFEGNAVPPATADMIVIGYARFNSTNPITRKVRIILAKDIGYDLSIGAQKKISLKGINNISGINNMSERIETGGGMHSNYTGTLFDPSIDLEDGDLRLGWKALLSSVGESHSFFSRFRFFRNKTPPKPLPKYSIREIVEQKIDCEPIPDITEDTSFENTTYKGSFLSVAGEHYLDGNLVIDGDIFLYNASLFIDGNLTVKGGIKGLGGIFVTGDVNVEGGNVVLFTNQRNAVSLFADGEVSIKGMDTSNYLSALADENPDIKEKYQKFTDHMEKLASFINSKETDGTYNFTAFKNDFGSPPVSYRKSFIDGSEEGVEEDGKMVIPLPPPPSMDEEKLAMVCMNYATHLIAEGEDSPPEENKVYCKTKESDGFQSFGDTSASLPALIRQIETSLGPDLQTNKSAKRALQGLDELMYFFRHPHDRDANMAYHDHALPLDSQSLDHQLVYTVRPTGIWADPGYEGSAPRRVTPENILNVAQNFVETNNPKSPEWGRDSFFQGTVYANDTVRLENHIQIYGTVVSQRKVRLRNSGVVYVKEYTKLTGKTAPVHIVRYQEL